MIEGKFLKYEDGFSDILELRKKVFIDEFCYPIESLKDELDSESEHVIVFNEKHEVVASGRLSFIDKEFWISMVAVLKEEREKYYGDFVVRMLVDKVFRSRVEQVWVKADDYSYLFFTKLGFHTIETVNKSQSAKFMIMKLSSDSLCKKCSN
jgi:predicted GNAT family N-acyltransferase